MQVDTERMSRESKLSKEEDTELLSTTFEDHCLKLKVMKSNMMHDQFKIQGLIS
jgi:hypothetical protein